MRKITLALAILGATLASTLFTAPAHAQATRTWVSGVGDDANPCSRTAPCKTFAGAISKTANGGEINCLDGGGFGGVTITKSITIKCPSGGEFGVLVSGSPGITVAGGPTDKIYIEGLDIEGLGTGTNGINFVSGLELVIRNCEIHDFATTGVNVASSTNNARTIIQSSIILNNGTNGTANTGGVNVQGNGVANSLFIIDTLLENNQNYSAQVTGASNSLSLLRSTLGPNGFNKVNSGVVNSFGPSNVWGGGSVATNTFNFQ
jgi:hypothetical protein